MAREEYVSPVGFAREPSRRWIGRIVLFAFVILIAWVIWTQVINPPSDTGPTTPNTTQTLAPF